MPVPPAIIRNEEKKSSFDTAEISPCLGGARCVSWSTLLVPLSSSRQHAAPRTTPAPLAPMRVSPSRSCSPAHPPSATVTYQHRICSSPRPPACGSIHHDSTPSVPAVHRPQPGHQPLRICAAATHHLRPAAAEQPAPRHKPGDPPAPANSGDTRRRVARTCRAQRRWAGPVS